MSRSDTVWRTWGRTEVATPERVEEPSHASDIQALVREAADRGITLKPLGAGHSFTSIAVTAGVQLRTDRFHGLLSADVDQGLVTLGAGTRLADVPALIGYYGLAMPNLGDIDRQTLGGAVSTGTHGTGSRFGGLATQVAAVQLITGTGELITVSEEQNADLLDAVRIGLGALGVLVSVTLRCVPAFALAASERPEPLEAVLADFEQRCDHADHFEFYWFPHTATALTKTNTRLPADTALAPRGRLSRFVDDTLVSNELYRGLCAVEARVPRLTPAVNRLAVRATGNRSFTDRSHRVFTTRRTVRFREMEYALPRAAVPAALRAIDRMIKDRNLRVSFPVEVRSAAADQLWLSTAHDRLTGYIAVHRYHRDRDTERFFDAVEEILLDHDGRPHWGKLHTLTAGQLREKYPRFDDFLAARDRLDPNRVFANPHLDRILGS
ncbi:D-arabinono-1,4-lactone oxidase [Microlunatus sp. Gsoil 973]|uniref:D-arabinono-1,4-lactone oxidase n=1 Tax=Microlunatus sp. Gsoil 973 TaxID=2672569 RepID=UPI001E2AA810|nr:D-arabinono-1,4-lactone oxidase [Microlunatus sp. Gsoil 973]